MFKTDAGSLFLLFEIDQVYLSDEKPLGFSKKEDYFQANTKQLI